MSNVKCVLMLSGGMDSLTCLAIAHNRQHEIHTLSFDYGQKMRAELDAAEKISDHYGTTHKVIEIPALGELGGTSLTDKDMEVMDADPSRDGIPDTYVPSRNLIFSSFALSYAEIIDASYIMIGCSSVDYSDYPDCTQIFTSALGLLSSECTKKGRLGDPIAIDAPLILLSKAETVLEGQKLKVDYSMSVSCYRPDEDGRACGTCDSCKLRKKGFEEAHISDPTRYIEI